MSWPLSHELSERWERLRGGLPRWVKIIGYATRDFVIDNGIYWSAAVAFYAILSLFPLALSGVSIAAWFIEPAWAVSKASGMLGEVMPRAEILQGIIQKAVAARAQTGLFSLLLLLWAGRRVFAVLIRALNIACDVDETYGFFRRLLIELAMLLSVGLLFVAALVSGLLTPVLSHVFSSIPHGRAITLRIIGEIAPAIFLAGGLFCLYKFVPRHRCNWQSCLIGAATATAGILGARPLFLTYVGKLASFNQIYGWLAIGIVFLIWAEIVAVITLFCGELASHIQMMAWEGLSGKEVSRRHRVRSPGTPSGPGEAQP